MNLAIQKTLALLLLIAVGVLLKAKVAKREQLGGVKVLILSVALPATIFVALLKIKVESTLIWLPLLALSGNLLLLLAAYYLLPLFGINRETPSFRTYWLLLPSLAPGLSCFPFVVEYLGEATLAQAALADVGNKVFVLILLYLLAMHLYYRRRAAAAPAPSQRSRIKDLCWSLLREPVNLVIVAALVMLAFGWSLDSLPGFLRDPILRMSAMMTPLVLLFIGIAARFRRRQFSQILHLLLLRSGMAFCLSALLLLALPTLAPPAALLAVVFPQSAASFWPFAHMSAVAGLEKGLPHTFDLELALNILALSLPFSTLLILTICSIGSLFTQAWLLLPLGAGLVAVGLAPALWQRRAHRQKKTTARNPDFVPMELAEVKEE